MQQSKLASLAETLFSTVSGFLISIWVQVEVFPHYGIHVSVQDNIHLVAIFTVVSVIRSYIVRRLFNAAPWRKFKERKNV